MRACLVYPDLSERVSLGRELGLIARTLRNAGAEVEILRSSGWSAAREITRRRAELGVVLVQGTATWTQDLVRVHAVIRAEQARWPERGGRTFRFARARAFASPLLHPRIAADRTVQRLQLRPGRFARALAVTDEVAADLVERQGVDAGLIDVVPCLIDYDRFAAVANGSAGHERRLVFIGNDFERKGLADTIEALRLVDDDVRLEVVGSGDAAPYAQLAAEVGVADRVAFTGSTSEPERALAGATALVLPTREDVWGMVVHEAMTAGVPVITSSIAGAGAVIGETGAGILVDPSDVRGLGAAIAGLLDSPERRAEMGARGRTAAERLHRRTEEAMVSAFERQARG